MRKVIAIDQDQVLADLLSGWLDKYNQLYNDDLKPDDIKSWRLSDYVKDNCGNYVYKLLEDYDLFRNLPVIEHSQYVVERLNYRHDVYITTSATSIKGSLAAKVEWINEHFPFIPDSNIVLCGDKSIIHADIMIDDGIHNLRKFKGERKLLFDAPHNRNNNEFERVNNWLEIGDLLL